MAIMTLTLNQIDVDAVKAMLGECKTVPEKVISRALNKTLTGIKTDASTEIRAILNAKKADVDATFKVTKSSVADMTCKFESTGKPLPLLSFGARQTQKGISVQVKKTVARSVVLGSFFATLKSGHKGVFWRKWHNYGVPTKTGMEVQMSKLGYFWSKKSRQFLPAAILPYQYRLPIKELFSSRIPDVLSDPPVLNAILDKANERLVTNLDREVNYELSKFNG